MLYVVSYVILYHFFACGIACDIACDIVCDRRLSLFHSCLDPIIEEVNALIKEPLYLRFADRKVRMCQAFYHFCRMDGEEVAVSYMISP